LEIEKHYIKFLVIRDRNKVVGCAGVKKLTDEIVEFKRMYILPEYRGKGLGKKLIEVRLECCRSENFKKVVLDTTTRNTKAIKLFKMFGFQETKREGEKIFFEKDLTLSA